MEYKVMGKKEIKQLYTTIKKHWDADFSLDYCFLNSKGKIFLVSKGFRRFESLRINTIGLYLGEIVKNELRLSIEGSQIVGKHAKKGIAHFNDKQSRAWLRGLDVETDEGIKGFVLIQNKEDFLGCGKAKDGIVNNYVPKERRLKTDYP